MKKRKAIIPAALMCAAMILSACTQNGGNTTAVTSGNSVNDTAKDPNAPAKITKFKIEKSTARGNSGDVKLEKGDTYAVISVKGFGDIKVKLYPDLAPYPVYNFVELAKKGAYNGKNFHRLIENFMIQGGSANGEGGGGECIDGGNFKNYVNTSLRHYYGALCFAASGLGDITDGFYIVNDKRPKENIEDLYDMTYNNFSGYAGLYGSYLSSFDPSMENYDLAVSTYSSLVDYNNSASEAVKAMKETITDDVKKTYAEKGGAVSLDGGYTVFGQTVEGFEVIDKITAVDKEVGGDGAVSKPTKEIIIDKVEIFTME